MVVVYTNHGNSTNLHTFWVSNQFTNLVSEWLTNLFCSYSEIRMILLELMVHSGMVAVGLEEGRPLLVRQEG